MIQKLVLQSIINKYYLGVNESVKWKTQNNELTIDFITPNTEIIGNVTCTDFQLQDSELAIFDTKKLNNLVGITNGELLLELEQHKSVYTKFKISDLNYNLTYALSDPLLIGKIGTVNEQEYEVELRLEKEDIEALIKAKSALVGIDNMKINTTRNLDDEKVCEFVFGDEVGHNNKITYQLRGRIDNEDLNLPFASDMFKTVLYANKDQDYGILKLSSIGLLHLQFISDTITSDYYMVRKADESF